MEGLERVQQELGGPDVVDRLAALSGSDFTTVMLEVARRRAAKVSALTEHLRFAIAGLRAVGDRQVQVALTPLSDGGRRITAELTERLRDTGAEILTDDARQARRGYYLELCFKINTESGEIGDGGFTDWTAKLTSNAKERLLISGYGLDRLASGHPSGALQGVLQGGIGHERAAEHGTGVVDAVRARPRGDLLRAGGAGGVHRSGVAWLLAWLLRRPERAAR